MRIVVPEHLISKVIKVAHESKEAAHGGVSKTCYHLRNVWFPSFRNLIEKYCKRCTICLKAKGFGNQYNTMTSSQPFPVLEKVFMDVVGPLPNDTKSYVKDARYVLTIMDDGSRYLKAIPMQDSKRNTIIDAFRDHWVSTFGAPKVVLTDNNEQFKGTFRDFCKSIKANNEYTAPYSPEMNAVERVHLSLMSRVRALRYTTRQPWSECLHTAAFGYNIAEHSMLGVAPYTLVFSKEYDLLTGQFKQINEIAKLRLIANSQARKKREDRLQVLNKSRNDQVLSRGDLVYVKPQYVSKLDDRVFEIKYKIKDFVGKNIILLQSEDGKVFKRARKDVFKQGDWETLK